MNPPNNYDLPMASSFTPCYGCTYIGCELCDYSEERLLALDFAETKMRISSLITLAVVKTAMTVNA